MSTSFPHLLMTGYVTFYQRNQKYRPCVAWPGPGRRGWGVLLISSVGDDQRIFGGLKFSILGFFCVGKFGKYFFGWIDLSRDFFGYQNNLKIHGSASVSQSVSQYKMCNENDNEVAWSDMIISCYIINLMLSGNIF